LNKLHIPSLASEEITSSIKQQPKVKRKSIHHFMMRSLSLISILAALPILVASTQAPASQDEGPVDFNAIFKPVLSSGARLYLPNDPEYFKVNERWSNLQDPSYVAAIQPATEEDVKNIVCPYPGYLPLAYCSKPQYIPIYTHGLISLSCRC
jgi:hypothetical protein